MALEIHTVGGGPVVAPNRMSADGVLCSPTAGVPLAWFVPGTTVAADPRLATDTLVAADGSYDRNTRRR